MSTQVLGTRSRGGAAAADAHQRSEQVELPPAVDAPREIYATPELKEISWYADGPEGTRPLLLLHSINAAPSVFEMKPLFEHYRAERRVYAPDLPGFGFSDRSDRRYSPELYAEAITAFLTDVVKEPADVVAFSLTSEFAARACLQAPERFNTLALLSPTGFSKRRLPSGGVGRALHRVFTLPGLSQGLYNLLTKRGGIRYFLRQSYVGEPPDELIDYAYATSHQPGARHVPYYFLSGQLFTRDAVDNLYAKLKLPVLVIHDKDANVTFDLLSDHVASHANWQTAKVEPTLGIPQWERPTRTIAALDEFWRTTEALAATRGS
ncbi:alpha/beta fold hydrolase [Thiohalocapsa sp. ML1]|jgi:pimeloyl-ACP methyl ester carboxylesterase|uniref:alpha/beta fold hydrolase n=1 Tax=Thiohalocapsa sp. ML1 TaxID=1431688 RepID=UPI0009EBA96B|nr:alpha/beta hydrolase [Thiohalocapsa sp. ML1]